MPADGTVRHAVDTGSAGAAGWAATYVRAREREGRLYPDEVVAQLPHVPPDDRLAAEWRLRAESADALVRYLRRLPLPVRAVEAGCGNGWLANAIAGIDGSDVVGLDANELELRQAARVFDARANLRFVLGDVTTAPSPMASPTVVVLASVVQYVADLPSLVERLLGWLAPGGELHILDSPLYAPDEVAAAAERSRRHYEAIGAPEMIGVYRHHEWRELAPFEPVVLYSPDAMRTRLERRLLRAPRPPFPWLRISAGRR